MKSILINYMEKSAKRMKTCYWWKYYAITMTILYLIEVF